MPTKTAERTDSTLPSATLLKRTGKAAPILMRKGLYADHRGVTAAMVTYWARRGSVILVGDKVDRDASDARLNAAIAKDRERARVTREPGKPGRPPRPASPEISAFARRVAVGLAADLGVDAARVLVLVETAARRICGDLSRVIELTCGASVGATPCDQAEKQ